MQGRKGSPIIKHRLRYLAFVLVFTIFGGLGGILWFSHDVQAAALIVNDLGDATDINPGDGTCETGVGNGICTLRAAVAESNALGGSNTITFSVAGTIDVATHIDITNGGTTIDGGASHDVVLNGAAKVNNGLYINNVADNVIKGLVLQDFLGAIRIYNIGATGNKIQNNYIGTNAAGDAAVANNYGVSLSGGASSNFIGTDGDGVNDSGERNVISGNTTGTGYGVYIEGTGTNSNRIAGNYIGTNAAGTAAIANDYGVYIKLGAQFNIIGTNGDGNGDAAERNIISGNTDNSGVYIEGTGTDSNTVAGNYIGLNAAGDTALPQAYGVHITSGPSSNIIGTNGDGVSDDLERNVISGNTTGTGYGVYIYGTGTNSNRIAGNYIGTNAAGTAAIANDNGLQIFGGAQSNIIGTNGDGNGDAVEGNIISGNTSYGVYINGTGTDSNTVAGNYIGLNAAGDTALPQTYGVYIYNGAQSNIIGTNGDGVSDDLERNVISGNTTGLGYGVWIRLSGTNSNRVAGNYIGINAAGTVAIANDTGVFISQGAQSNIIGTNSDGNGDAAERNIISGNNNEGVYIRYANTSSNTVKGNYIGVGTDGTTDFGNGLHGIRIDDTATSNIIGGTGANDANIIAFNGDAALEYGISIEDVDTDLNLISRNSIHDNQNEGIKLTGGSNDGIATPAITGSAGGGAAATITLSGTSLVDAGTATIELFISDGAGEGETYLATATTTDGNWTADITGSYTTIGTKIVATVTDSTNNTSEFSSEYTITDLAAVASTAGSDASVNELENATLVGTSSYDPNFGQSVTSYLWERTAGEVIIINNSTSATANFDAPSITGSDSSATVRLTVNGGDTDQVVITIVNTNDTPTVNSVSASQILDGSGKVDISFIAEDTDLDDTFEALVEYDISDGAGWQKATISTVDLETTAIFGDPDVNNADTYPIGEAGGYVQTSSGANTVSSVWNASVDEPTADLADAKIRVTPYDGIDVGSAVESATFDLDLVAPEYVSSSYLDIGTNGTIDRVDITFTEPVTLTLYNASDWSFPTPGDMTLDDTSAVASGSDIQVSVSADADETGSTVTPTIQYTNNASRLTDAAGNPVATFSTPEDITDAVKPIITAISPLSDAIDITRTDPIIITFSESMNTSFVYGTEYSVSPNPDGWGAAVWSDGDKTVTLSHTIFGCSALTSVTTDETEITDASPAANILNVGIGVPEDGDWLFTVRHCGGSGGTIPTITYLVTVISPNGGEVLNAGGMAEINWSTDGTGYVNYVNLAYSLDGGTTYTSIVNNEFNDGSYLWSVPDISTSQAAIRVQLTDLAITLASDASNQVFTINSETTTPEVPPVRPEPGTLGPSPVTGEMEEISVVDPGDYITSPSFATVYYIDSNWVRHPFMESQIFFTWQDSFNNVRVVTDATLPTLTLGTPMLPKPGVVLTKIQSDPNVYAEEVDSTSAFKPILRQIISESVATGIYGTNWAAYVIDVPVTLFNRFNFGQNIDSIDDIISDMTQMKTRDWLNAQ